MRNSRSLLQSLGLRTTGLGLVALAAFAVMRLYHMVHTPPVHQGTPAELAIAAVVFFGASGGVLLFVMGNHIFDKVEVSARWAPIGKSER